MLSSSYWRYYLNFYYLISSSFMDFIWYFFHLNFFFLYKFVVFDSVLLEKNRWKKNLKFRVNAICNIFNYLNFFVSNKNVHQKIDDGWYIFGIWLSSSSNIDPHFPFIFFNSTLSITFAFLTPYFFILLSKNSFTYNLDFSILFERTLIFISKT